MSLPSISLIKSSSSVEDRTRLLTAALSTLFEPSSVLVSKLVPALAAPSSGVEQAPSYDALVDLSTRIISTWDLVTQASFIAAHPRIGQVANLSQLSQREQAARAAPPEVLASLARLNERYEARFPGLRYITFVNGRDRAAVRDEMLHMLGEEDSEMDGKEPPTSYEVGGEQWCAELERAVGDVGRIAKSRARALGAE